MGDADSVKEFLKNGTRFTREELLQVYGLG
jgi:hypothetical protein